MLVFPFVEYLCIIIQACFLLCLDLDDAFIKVLMVHLQLDKKSYLMIFHVSRHIHITNSNMVQSFGIELHQKITKAIYNVFGIKASMLTENRKKDPNMNDNPVISS